MVRPLIAAIQECPGGVEAEAPGVIAAGPLLAQVFERALFFDLEDADAVVQAVPHVDEAAILGNQDLRAEVAACIPRRERRQGLPVRQRAGVAVVVEEGNGRSFFLYGIEPAAIRVEVEVPGTIPRGKGDLVLAGGCQFARAGIKGPDEDGIQPQVDVEHEPAGGVRLDHVGMGAVVPTEGETPRRGVLRAGWPDGAVIDLHIRGGAKLAIVFDGQHRDRPAEVVGDEQKSAAGVNAHVGRPGAARGDRIQGGQRAILGVDGIGTDSPFLAVADAVGLVRGVEAGPRSVHRQATGAGAEFEHPGGRQGPGRAIDPEDVDAAAISRG